MKLPNKLVLGNENLNLKVKDIGLDYGLINLEGNEIFINKTLSQQKQFKALVHESLHKFFNDFSIEDDEFLVRALTNHFLAILKQCEVKV